MLLGIEQIGTEIENPFGDDANDLDLEEICTTIVNNIEDLVTVNSQETLEFRSSELENIWKVLGVNITLIISPEYG